MLCVINSRFLTQKITGSQRFAIEISKQLKKMDHDILFVAPKNILHKNIAEELEVKTIGINKGHLWEQVDLPLYLKRIGSPLLVNLVNTAPLFYKNKVVTIHDISWKHFPCSVSKKFYSFYNFLIPKIAKNSLLIFTVSEFSKNDISKNLNIDKDKVEVIYNAIACKFKRIDSIKKKNIILSVATLQPYKNMEGLIKSFILLKSKYSEFKNYKLVLVGGINQKVFRNTGTLNLIGNKQNIVFTGYVSDNELVKWYNKAKLFVLVSKFEGFGIPPLEAMACGTPVIVSNVASLPEVCGDAAYYVDPYNVENIAKGMKTVLENESLQKELIQKGFKRVKMFSWEKSAQKIIGILERFS
ncbi:glycosyltransferase family 4 protein [Hippea alviniae]|uniref:glycosyltransferase family 4 protein n=1 Tax=Hippea alviniae TaxID=1279027 RepID=UPI0003B34827|nr:glycosyltransferase family 1 protein [Hippea alviniae]